MEWSLQSQTLKALEKYREGAVAMRLIRKFGMRLLSRVKNGGMVKYQNSVLALLMKKQFALPGCLAGLLLA